MSTGVDAFERCEKYLSSDLLSENGHNYLI